MYLNKTKLILESQLKSFDGLTKDQIEKIQVAMHLYAIDQVNEFKNRDIKEEAKNFFKLFTRDLYTNAILWMRKRLFVIGKRNAQLHADTSGYKTYLIRKSRIGFQILNTYEANQNKKLRILGKDVDFMDLEKVSSFIAYPKKR